MSTANPLAVFASNKKNANIKLLVKSVAFVILLGCAFISLFPFLWMILSSFKSYAEINSPIPTVFPKTWVFGNFAEAWNEPDSTFSRYYWNTIVISIAGVGLQMGICIPAAYALATMKFRFKEVLFMGIVATMMIPGDLTLVPNFMIIRGMPLMGGNDIFGVGGKGLYDSYMGIILPGLASSFSIFLLRQAFMAIPRDYWQAAQIDGMNHFGYMRRVVMPLSAATIITASLLAFIGRWNSLQWPLLITSSEHMRPLQVGLMFFRSEDGQSPQLIMAAATFCILPILALYFFVQKQFTEAIVGAGVKG